MPISLHPVRIAAAALLFAVACPAVGVLLYPVFAFGPLGFALYGEVFGSMAAFAYATGALPSAVAGMVIARIVAARPRRADHLFPAALIGGFAALVPLAFWLRDVVESGGGGSALAAATISSALAIPGAGMAAALVATLPVPRLAGTTG